MANFYRLDQRYLRAQQASEYTGLSLSTIRMYVQLKKIPFIKRGRCILFDTFELDSWLKEGLVVSTSTVNKEDHV